MAILNALLPTGLRRAAWSIPPLHRLASLGAMRRAVATRRQLAALDDRTLKDLGITRVDALAEAARAPWDLTTRRTGWRD